ncbi:hypothetical protein Bca52824_050514 [Brassica carinata]|uniref:glutathione transferase n=1 Tax=Brassica carinata TaxID=52824 RepID=A0A8X7R693_BRACI|nr:hypothetical protein Bca52824_050514 [Brassica carinata]
MCLVEDRQVPLDATSDLPTLFDGTTRLYISYTCPFAQRVWITRNLKGLQENIKLVPIDLPNRPAWFKEKVNPANKVPALEHNGKIMGESLDLIKYVDSNFEGPSLYPLDPEKRNFGEDMLKYVDTTFTKVVFGSFKGDPAKDTASVFNHLENALQKFDDGPFFLGDLSLVDVAYIPFVQRFQVFLGEVFKYDITAGRPKLAAWIEEMNKMVAYTQTITESEYVINFFKNVLEHRPASLDATADPPALFDGTTRLYTSYSCPYAQRVWITRNFKGLQEKIKLVPLDLENRPAWYKEKVYPENKVPALEHNGKIIGESLDLIKYLDHTFEGPSLFPEDNAKREFGEELLKYTDTFTKTMWASLKGDPFTETAPVLDYLENSLYKFDDGPFFLGQFSLVDTAYIPFIERFQIVLNELFKCDITAERPKLSAWIEEMNKIDAYVQTKTDSKEIVEIFKRKLI